VENGKDEGKSKQKIAIKKEKQKQAGVKV